VIFGAAEPSAGLPAPASLLTPEMRRMLKMERLGQLGAALLEQSGYQPVAPTFGEGFGKAMRSLPAWSDVLAQATQRAASVRQYEQETQENQAINDLMRNEVVLPGEDASMRLSRVIPKLMSMGERGRQAAAALAQSLSAMAPDLVDVGGAIEAVDPFTKRPIAGRERISKVKTYEQISSERQASVKNMTEAMQRFDLETTEDRVAKESWVVAVNNNALPSAKRAQLTSEARAFEDRVFLEAIIAAIQPETKPQPGQAMVLTIQPKDADIVKKAKEWIIGLGEGGKFLSKDAREELLNTAQRVLETRQQRFYNVTLPRWAQRLKDSGLEDYQENIIRDYYKNVPMLPDATRRDLFNRTMDRVRGRRP